ncbi:hypothetical protein ISF6_0544 [Piscinibacter sakaiensis]|uniref:Uncharacterized protein n=1 Tax=Piscinibacter sakaiensis TaxID=1547922 RepID=A0A0K8NXG9_PISS1|nr:hypothetical protein ISF6_0544 [Piscinibacter sakaiensis]
MSPCGARPVDGRTPRREGAPAPSRGHQPARPRGRPAPPTGAACAPAGFAHGGPILASDPGSPLP